MKIGEIQKFRTRLVWVNRLLMWAVPLVAVAATIEAATWLSALGQVPEPITPNLEELKEPLAAIPAVEIPARLFQAAQEAQGQKASLTEAPVEEARQWVLKGVMMGATPRAFLQDAQGKQSTWATEGQRVGSFRIKEIREKSVVVEKDGKIDEIRM